jgi:L-fuconolactonase
VARVDPDDVRSLTLVAGIADDAGVAGFRLPLIGVDDSWLSRYGDRCWELAAVKGMIVSLLLASEQLASVEPLIARRPEVPVVIDHLARFDLSADRSAAIGRLCELSSLANVHVKASALATLSRDGWPYRDVWRHLLRVIEAFGPGRVMWGSDYPFIVAHAPYADSYRAVEAALAGRDPSDRDDVLSRNALRLFFARGAENGVRPA